MSKEPLYPHVPKSRQTQFPHVPKGQQASLDVFNVGDKVSIIKNPAGSTGWLRKVGTVKKRLPIVPPTTLGDNYLVEFPDGGGRWFYGSELSLESEKLPQILPQTGTCYEDAWRFLIKEEEGELVHGTLFSGGRRMGHAWVETLTGWVWEPETGKFFTVSGFKDAFAPVIEARYTAEEAAIMAARTKNLGPWSEQERLQYLGVRQPDTIALLASTEGDPIRKFCCRQCGECAPTELLAEGMFLDRISWLRSHYKEKHPGMWGKVLPMTDWLAKIQRKDCKVCKFVSFCGDIFPTEGKCPANSGGETWAIFTPFKAGEGGEPVSLQYRHLTSLVREPLPKDAD